jgi:two-component system phosphate regulon sensor histidine kinase PhoR
MTKTINQLITENEELHSLLVETEEILNAIRNGEMDAIVVSGTKGDQVYSISSAEAPYRTFIEEMNEGALTLTKDGIIIYCNHRFAELVNEPIEQVTGSYFRQFIDNKKDRSEFDKLLSKKSKNKNVVLIISLNNSVYLKLSFHLLPAYLHGDNFILIATDISELKKKENELLELHHLLEQKLNIIERLRLQLIDKKIDDELVINKLKIGNKKLVKEITKRKLAEAEIKQKVKQKKSR